MYGRVLCLLLTTVLLVASPLESIVRQKTGAAAAALRGDIDENQKIDVFDLLSLLRFLSGSPPSGDRQLQIANLDKSADNKISIFDLLALLRVLGGLEPPDTISFSNPFRRVWALGDGEKVFREDTLHFTSQGNRVWDGDTIRLKGLYNEVLAFQVILTADSLGASQVDISMDPPSRALTGQEIGGPGAIEYGPDGYFEVFSEHYIHVVNPTSPNWFYGSAASAPARMTGWIPDALITPDAKAGKGGLPLDISAGLNQGFWFDLYLPRDSVSHPSGTYYSTVRVRAGGWQVESIPVKIILLPYFLPDSTHSNVWLYHDSVNRYYQDYMSSQDIERMLKYTARRHRIDLVGGFRPHYSSFDSTVMGAYRPYLDGSAFTAAAGYQGPGQGQGERLFPIGMYGGSVMGQTWSEVYRNSDLWVNWFEAHAPSVKYFWYLIDEPGEDMFPWIKERASWIHLNPGPGKRLPVFVTRAWTSELDKDIDLWAGYDGVPLTRLATLQGQGKDHWFYNGNRPRYGSVILEAEAVDFRVNAWIKYLYGINTWFIWHGSHWIHNSSGPRAGNSQNVFVDPVTFISSETTFGNGDGIVFYPGHDPVFTDQDRGVNRLFGSIKLKNIRRGQQDFELMWLAERKAGKEEVLKIIRSVAPHGMSEVNMSAPVPWSQRGDDYEAAREKLLEIISR